MKPQKVKAGALQFTMFIVVVVALLLASFIILINTYKRFNIQTDFVIETIDNANRGIDYALKNPKNLKDTLHINLQDEDYKSLKVNREYWGLFEKVTASSKIKTNTFIKVALVGASQLKKDRIGLYVQDNNRPLVVVGNTKIEGVAFLPKQGVRTGNISGHSYYGNQLIYGLTRTSIKLPEIFKETLDQIKTIKNNIKNINPNQFLDLNESRTHQNSFLNPLQVIYSNSDINLSEVSLTGHILVQSKTKISVDVNSNLKDVVLVAPEIEIKNHVKGTFQAVASKKIDVGKSCMLNYPSSLILNDTKKKSEFISGQNIEESKIIINSGSIIKGVVLSTGEKNLNNYKAQIIVEEEAIIEGELYCNQNLELKGSVYGSVFTSNFVAKQSGSVYQNHIYNGNISIDKLAKEYVGLLFQNSNRSILKWLY